MGLMDFLKKIGVVKAGGYAGTGEEVAGMDADMAMMNNGQEAPAMPEPEAPAPEAPAMPEPEAPAPEAPSMPETSDTPMA